MHPFHSHPSTCVSAITPLSLLRPGLICITRGVTGLRSPTVPWSSSYHASMSMPIRTLRAWPWWVKVNVIKRALCPDHPRVVSASVFLIVVVAHLESRGKKWRYGVWVACRRLEKGCKEGWVDWCLGREETFEVVEVIGVVEEIVDDGERWEENSEKRNVELFKINSRLDLLNRNHEKRIREQCVNSFSFCWLS